MILTFPPSASLVPPSTLLFHGKKLIQAIILQPSLAEEPFGNRSSLEPTSIWLTKMPLSRTRQTTFGEKGTSSTSPTQSRCRHAQPSCLPRVQVLETGREPTRGDPLRRNMRCGRVDLAHLSNCNDSPSFPSDYIALPKLSRFWVPLGIYSTNRITFLGHFYDEIGNRVDIPHYVYVFG